MRAVRRNDLKYSNYLWTPFDKEDPHVYGTLDSTFLDRQEGFEVLYFINSYAQMHGISSASDLVNIEEMLIKHVPIAVRSQNEIAGWVKQHWSNVYADVARV